MPHQPLLSMPPRRLPIAIAGLIAAALGASAVLFAQSPTAPQPAPPATAIAPTLAVTATTTTAPSTALTPPATTSLPAHSRPRPLRNLPDSPSALPPPTGPINARIGSGPIDASANPGQRNPGQIPTTPPSGQALNATLPPPGDKVEVFKNNAWLPAQVIKREGNRVYISYDGEGGNSDEWVGPNRVRSK